MTCEEFRRRLDGDEPTDTGEAAAHLERCADCRRLAERADLTRRALRALREEAPPPFLHARVMAHLRDAEPRARRWQVAARPAWAGAALVALLLVAVSGYRLAEWLRPAPRAEAPVVVGVLQAPAPAGEGAAKSVPSVAPNAAPAAPATRHAANGGAVAKHHQTAPRVEAPAAGRFAPAPPALAAQREEAVAGDTIAAGAAGTAAAPGERRDSARLADAAPAPPAAMAPQMQAMGATSHIAIACELAGERGVVARFRLGPGDAPPGAAAWTVIVAANGSLAVRDPSGHDLPAARRPVAVALAGTRLAAGTYLLRRVAP